MKDNCKNIAVIPIDDTHLSDIQNIADANNVRPFKGTFQIHQITWSSIEPNVLHARRLSCTTCPANTKCPHFEIGQIQVQHFTNPLETQSLPATPSSSGSRVAVLSSASSNETTAASTVTGPGTPSSPEPRVNTPTSEPLVHKREPLAPRKRLNFENIYSDDSISLSSSKKFKSRPSFFDSGDESDKTIKPIKRPAVLGSSDDSDENII